jgi:hypothetical protein
MMGIYFEQFTQFSSLSDEFLQAGERIMVPQAIHTEFCSAQYPISIVQQ